MHINLPKSKSIYIRRLILNFLYFNKLEGIEKDCPNDVVVVHRALSKIRTAGAQSDTHTAIFVEDCGAALRFLLPILAITPGKWLLSGSVRLLQRPINQLVTAMKTIGAEIEICKEGFFIIGKKLTATAISIDARESSQFISAILLISKKLGLKNINFLNPNLPSMTYVNLTIELLKTIGISVQLAPTCAQISSTEKIEKSLEEWAESDWSSAAFWYAVVALTDDLQLEMEALDLNSWQGDRAAAEIFANFGVVTTKTENGIIIEKRDSKIPKNLHFDLSGTPDLSPILCVFAALKSANIAVSGLKTLNSKESRRFDILQETLSQFVKVDAINDSELHIFGTEKMPKTDQKLQFNCHKDHRFVIAFSLFEIFYNDVQLTDTECVTKSYPHFFQTWRPILAKIRRRT